MSAKTNKKKKVTKRVKAEKPKKELYFEAVGRRKTAVARVRIYPASAAYSAEVASATKAGKATAGRPVGKAGKVSITVNDKELEKYFPTKKNQNVVTAPFDKLTIKGMKSTVKVKGSGLSAQAEAIRLGISRALLLFDKELRPRLKAFGYLTRDSRMVERKKPGLRKARRPQQWRKR
jgi:small subunit ribosomal protein S9